MQALRLARRPIVEIQDRIYINYGKYRFTSEPVSLQPPASLEPWPLTIIFRIGNLVVRHCDGELTIEHLYNLNLDLLWPYFFAAMERVLRGDELHIWHCFCKEFKAKSPMPLDPLFERLTFGLLQIDIPLGPLQHSIRRDRVWVGKIAVWGHSKSMLCCRWCTKNPKGLMFCHQWIYLDNVAAFLRDLAVRCPRMREFAEAVYQKNSRLIKC